MPDRDSKPVYRRHAGLIAKDLGIELKVREITPILEAI